MPDNDLARLHAFVEGGVQGVGFRAFVLREASYLRLIGWVRNRRDGTVEVVAEGRREVLNRLLTALRRGPRAATVLNVKTEWLPATGEFKRFNVEFTI